MLVSVERLLGSLDARTKHISEDMLEVKQALQATIASDREMDERVDDLDDRLAAVEHALERAAVTLSEIERWRERGRGALLAATLLVSAVGAVGGWLITSGWEGFLRFIGRAGG